jgi:arsenate reductase (thioredoxin)
MIKELLEKEQVLMERKQALRPLIDYIKGKLTRKEEVNLIFVCTHNSRRSQFAQVWAQVAADYYGIKINAHSAGVEVTACNERTIASLQRSGFQLLKKGDENPIYTVSIGKTSLQLFSKLIEDPSNPRDNFAAIMVCDHANDNCPFLPNAEMKLPLLYVDPKAFDDTDLESAKYDERSQQIAAEMNFVFKTIKNS